MNDAKLLVLSAKAAGIDILDGLQHDVSKIQLHTSVGPWNPLKDDGDALRLAVKLRIDLHFEDQPNWIGELVEAHGPEREDGSRHCETHALAHDPMGAVRLAIVRAAAEVGKMLGAPRNAG